MLTWAPVKKRRLLVACDDPASLDRIAQLVAAENLFVLRTGSLGDDLVAIAKDSAADAVLLASSKPETLPAAYKKLRREPELIIP